MRLASRIGVIMLMVVGGCVGGGQKFSGRTETVEVRLVDAGGGSGQVEIDRSHHEHAVVFRGDRVKWACDCPDGIEFTIEPPHLLVDLGGLEEALDHRHASVSEALQNMADASDNAPRVHPLFGEWTPGSPGGERWFDASEKIVSPAVAPGAVAHGVWKYTWKVRRKGDPETEDVWDPHIYGHTWNKP